MADVIVVMGAGCSKDSDAPMMNEFLDQARNLLDAGKVTTWRDDFELVFKAIGRLGAVHSKSQLNIVNLESIFNAFEMAALLGRFPGLGRDEIDRLLPALTTLIVRTLEESMTFPVQSGVLGAEKGYRSLADVIKWAYTERRPPRTTAIITFNYDIGMEIALSTRGVGFSYCLNDEHSHGVPLLKLHGSLNWLKSGESLRVLQVSKAIEQMRWFPADAPANMNLRISREHPDLGKGEPPSIPFIVPPTMSKGEHHRQILPVWRRAAAELGSARYVYICGYSLPPTDEFFRVLFSLGSEGPELLQSVVVIDPDTDVHERVAALLGPGAAQRFRALRGGFNSLGKTIQADLSRS